jgi:histidinol-phosphate aminotransferase
MQKMDINRRTALKLTGMISGTLLLDQWRSVKKWEAELNSTLATGSEELVRLCYNENPYGPSQFVKDYIAERMEKAHVYPFGVIEELAEKIAKKHGVDRRCVVVTAGSREGLKSAALSYAGKDKEVIACLPTYRALLDYAVLQGGRLRAIDLTEDLSYDLLAIEEEINQNTGLVFLCNPNNPTGTLLDGKEVLEFCKRTSLKTMLFADEVYYDYIDQANYPSMIELVKADYNVIVARTFSKIHGLAGIRVGYLIAPPNIAGKIRNNLQAATNIIGAWSAMAALDDQDFYEFSLKKNKEGLEMIYAACEQYGLHYQKAHANFAFIHTKIPIRTFQTRMKDMGVLVGRPFPPFIDWSRVSTGRIEHIAKFVDKLPYALKQQ